MGLTNNTSHLSDLNQLLCGFSEFPHFSFSINSALTTQSSVLPTFEGMMGGIPIRILKDSGCQINLISADLLPRIPHQVLESGVQLNIQGIPGSKVFSANLVKLNLNLGKQEYIIEAYSISTLSFLLYNPKVFGIAKQFEQQGYKLADPNLVKSIDLVQPVRFILGVRDSYILPEREVVFGHNHNSIYSVISAGIILKGDVGLLKKNVSSLHRPQAEYCLLSSCSGAAEKGGFFQTPAMTPVDDLVEPKPLEVALCSERGQVLEKDIMQAAEDILALKYKYVNHESNADVEMSRELHTKLINYTLDNTVQ